MTRCASSAPDPNNFNDLPSGIVTCFELLVVNNWFVIEEGYEVVYNIVVVRLFFTMVYVIGVLVCLNIVIAFCLDSFHNVMYKLEGLKAIRENESSGRFSELSNEDAFKKALLRGQYMQTTSDKDQQGQRRCSQFKAVVSSAGHVTQTGAHPAISTWCRFPDRRLPPAPGADDQRRRRCSPPHAREAAAPLLRRRAGGNLPGAARTAGGEPRGRDQSCQGSGRLELQAAVVASQDFQPPQRVKARLVQSRLAAAARLV